MRSKTSALGVKKILITFLAIYMIFNHIIVLSATNVTLTGIVWSWNYSPTVLSVTPNGNPEILAASSMQNFSLNFKDQEKDSTTYTITPAASGGSSSPTSGTINTWDFETNSWATISFTYSAPSSAVWNKAITVTLNDGTNVVSYDINLYIY